MCWKLSFANSLHVQCWLLLGGWSDNDVHGNSCVMCIVRGGQLLYRECGTASRLHVYCRVRLKFINVKWLYDDNGNV